MRRNILHKKDFYKVLSVSRCQDESTLLLDDEIIQNIQDLEKNLEFNSSDITYDNITSETFDTAAKMFTYLNHCPPKIVDFYKEFLKTSTLKDLILVLNRIQKNSLNTVQKSAIRILNKLAKNYDLKIFDERNLNFTKPSDKWNAVANHPIHVDDKNVELSPTALIPFCSFSGNFSLMGVENPNFNVPVCKGFSPKVLNDQLCYTTDPNTIKNVIDLNKLLYLGNELAITLYIDYNEDRHWGKMEKSGSQNIRLETIGKTLKH